MLSTVDTLKLSKEFEDVGFTQEQAEKMAITYKNMQEGLATKEDIDNLKKDINKDINHVKELLDSRIKPLYWMFGLGFAAIISLLTALLINS